MDSSAVAKKPSGLSPLAAHMFDVLARYTVFPWPVLLTQCQRLRIDPGKLNASAATKELVDNLATGVGRFTSPDKARKVQAELESLIVSALVFESTARSR
jgi:hypothetical protein